MDHETLMLITSAMPRKVIEINGEPYLERYFAGESPDGTQYWLHRFLRNDSERHLHSHPWAATSHLLCGWYLEELENQVNHRTPASPPEIITPGRLHRIKEVCPDTWTLMVVGPERAGCWYFIEDSGERIKMVGSGRDWHKNWPPRPASP